MNQSYNYLSEEGVIFCKNDLCEETEAESINELTDWIYDICSFQYYTGALSGKKEEVSLLVQAVYDIVIDEETRDIFLLILNEYDVFIMSEEEYNKISLITRTKYEYLRENINELLQICREDELSYLAIYEDLDEASIMYLESIGVHYDTALHILDFIDNEIMKNYLGIEYIPSTGMYIQDARW